MSFRQKLDIYRDEPAMSTSKYVSISKVNPISLIGLTKRYLRNRLGAQPLSTN